jgi:hypothetical protein
MRITYVIGVNFSRERCRQIQLCRRYRLLSNNISASLLMMSICGLGRLIQILLLGIAGTIAVNAFQSSCRLQLSSLPDIQEFNGLKMGMTVEEVRAIVPVVQIPRADEFGMARTSFTPVHTTNIDKRAFDAIRTVSLEFVDGRLASIWVGFNGAFKWQTIDAAIDGLSAELHLPAQWRSTSREQQLVCNDFRLGVSLVSNSPSIRIVNDTAKQLWQRRREAKEESEP